MSSLARGLIVRITAACSAVFLVIACGGSPSVTSRPDLSTGASGGMPGTGGSNGATGGNGVGGTLMIGGQGGENDAGSGNVDECAGQNPPPECFGVMPSGPGCGDAEINQAEEECDDGNGLPGDGCSGICQIEPYYECPEPGMPCEITITCGDSVLDPGEFCDDGNTEDGDGCSADCEMQDPDYVCPTPGRRRRLQRRLRDAG